MLNNGSDTVSAYSVNRTTGSLTPLPFSPISLGTGNWYCLAVSPGGSTLVASDLSGPLASFHITAGSASPAAGSPYATGAFPASCAFSQDGAYVYASANGTNIAGFSVNESTSVLTALSGSPFNSGGTPLLPWPPITPDGCLCQTILPISFASSPPAEDCPVRYGQSLHLRVDAGGPYGVLHPGGYYLVADRIHNRVGCTALMATGQAPR